MVEPVHAAHVLGIEMRVDLSRLDRGMAEHLLHRAQVRSAFDEVRRKGMEQRVGGDAGREPRTSGGELDPAPGSVAR